ncbi:hypothetical protein ABZ345_25690 [Lentzea sp. NPDC005914]|uniref:hypothetical protein n=1 Tax=Lentzea sp. NPDC005914 TaxID=3154572 RepID=UPI0033EDA2F9
MIVLAQIGLGARVALADPEPPPPPPPAQQQAQVSNKDIPTGKVQQADAHVAPQLQAIPEVPPVDPGPNGSVQVPREPSKALQDIPALPALNPAPGTVPVEKAPVVPNPQVRPYQLTLPEQPGQKLVDQTAADALATLRNAGRVTPQGTPDLDATKLQPQVSSAQFIDPTRRATLQELIDALTSGNIPPPLPVDPLALLNELPDGIPRITYRVCSESATKQVSCSLTLPLGVPAIVDVTGDRTPDVLADVLPAVAVGEIVGPVRDLLNVQRQIDDATKRLNVVLELLKDPLNVILHPELLIEKLQLESLLDNLKTTLEEKLQALLRIINVGLAMVTLRLPTSEFAGRDLPAHVWGVYDLPGHKRVSLGYDGFRRGTSLSTATIGIFTLNPFEIARGVFDVKASLLQLGAGEAFAITAGIASVRDDDKGDAYDPTVASARFSPVPRFFNAHAFIDMGASDRPQKATVDARSDVDTHLDAQVLTNQGGRNRFDQLKIDTLPSEVSAAMTRPVSGGETTINYLASSAISDVLFADYVYSGQLDWAVQAGAKAVPSKWDAQLKTEQDKISAHYTASGALESLDVNFYDRNPAIVGRGALRKLPAKVDFEVDRGAKHANFTADQPLGSANLAFSKNLGAFAPLEGDHTTVITRDQAIGASAQVSGLKLVDAFFDGHTRLKTEFSPGGQAFVGAADIDGEHKARMEISNLPKTASIDADTAARKIAYRASEVINRVHVAYTNTKTGPTLFGTVLDVPSTVDVEYDLGDKPRVKYTASSRISRVEVFASPDHVEQLRPEDDKYLSALTIGVPTSVEVLADLAAKHLQGKLAQQLDLVDVVARFPVAGRDWTASVHLEAVPADFDADWADGNLRFRALSAPLGVAKLAVTNHRGTSAPTGLHAAVHYRQTSGDLDASVSVRKLSHIEYSRASTGNQTFRLDTDTGGDPVFVDADVVLAANNADDTRYSVLGRIDNLPSTIRVDVGDGKITYAADRNVGLALNVAFGKISALNGLGAPLFANGVAAVARGCAEGAGCAKDESPFCQAFPRCFGVVGTVNLPGLPTGITIDLNARKVVLDDYRPTAPLQAYVGVHGLIDRLPDFKALATLSGVASPVDLTVGPLDVADGKIDVGYTATSPLGTLTLEADARTTDTRFPVLRAKGVIGKLPASMHLVGQLGDRTSVSMRNSAPVDEISLTVTSDRSGYLRAGVTGVPAEADVLVDAPAKHAEVTMSAPIGAVTALVRDIPVNGRNWSAFGDLRNIPSKFTADWAEGKYLLAAESAPLGSAAFAVTNHANAQAPTGSHLAVHYNKSTEDIDASAALSGFSRAEYTHTGGDFTTKFNIASQTIALDADVRLDGAVRLAALGRLGPVPSTLTIGSNKGVLTYRADRQLALELQAWLGKQAALSSLGAPKFANGIAVVDGKCSGDGCPRDDGPFCTDRGCYGVVGIINISGLPTEVTADLATSSFSFSNYRPVVDRLELYVDDSVFAPEPLTRAKAKVTLTNLPSAIDFKLGPISMKDGLEFKYDAGVVKAGSIEVHAEAQGVPKLGTARALAQLDPIPGKVDVKAKFAEGTKISVHNSTPITKLVLKASGQYEGRPASGIAQLTDVPAEFDITTAVKTAGITAPDFAYTSPASTLDGLFALEAQIIKATSDQPDALKLGISGVSFEFGDLGGKTEVTLKEDSSVEIKSVPKTPLIEFHTGLILASEVPRKEVDEKLFASPDPVEFFTGTLRGHYGVKPSKIDDIGFAMHDIGSLTIRPAKVPFNIDGVPAAAGYVMPAFDRGDYDRVEVGTSGVDINADVDLRFRIERPGPLPDAYDESLKIGRTNTIQYHRYDQQLRDISSKLQLSALGVDLGCLQLETRPGKVATGANGIVVRGADGQQMIMFLDPGDAIPDYLIDVLAQFASPFADAKLDVRDWNLGSC